MTDKETALEMDSVPMLCDVRRQPSVIEGLLARVDEIRGFARSHLGSDSRARLFAFGSGDGWFAGRVVDARSAPFLSVGSLEMLTLTVPSMNADDRFLAISMSGNVDRTVEAATAAVNNGFKGAALVNGGGGRLAALGLPTFSLDIEDIAPFLCGTASYTATLTVLSLIAAELDGALDSVANRLAATAAKLLNVLYQADAVASEMARSLAPSPDGVRLLSSGPAGIAVADYGAAKLVELAGQRPWTDDIEEFAHRQFWTANPSELVVYLPTTPEVAGYAAKAAEALAEMDFPTLSIGPERFCAPETRWTIGFDDRGADPMVLAAAALQMVAYRMSEAAGLNPNKRLHLKNDELRFRVSRMLTRRSLLGTGQ